jgi:hypothetical protein
MDQRPTVGSQLGGSDSQIATGHGTNASIGSAIELGSILISGTVALGGKLLEISGDVWGWIKKQFTNIVDTAQTLGTLTIDGAVALGNTLGPIVSDVWGWVKSHAQNVLDNVLQLGTLFVNGSVALSETFNFDAAATSVGTAIATAIANLASIATDIGTAIADKIKTVDWASVVTTDSFTGGKGLGTAVHDGIVGVLTDLADLSAEDVSGAINAIANGIKTAFTATATHSGRTCDGRYQRVRRASLLGWSLATTTSHGPG